jgi:hypothetical protein
MGIYIQRSDRSEPLGAIGPLLARLLASAVVAGVILILLIYDIHQPMKRERKKEREVSESKE